MKLHGNAKLCPSSRLLLVRRVLETSTQRNLALGPWIDYYNHRRPHGAVSHKPPVSRLTAA